MMHVLMASAEQATQSGDAGLIPALILLPLATMVAVLLTPNRRPDLIRQISVVGSTLTGAASIYMAVKFASGEAGMQFEVRRDWIADAGISWHFGVDGISLFLLVLTGILFPVALVGVKPPPEAKAYHAWLMLLMAEVGGQQRQVGLHIDAVAIPTLEGHNSEAVPQVVWAGPTRT